MPTRDAASGHGEGIAVSTAYDRSCTINRPFAERGEAIAALGALSARFDALHKRFGVTCLRPGNVFLTKEAFGLLFERYTVPVSYTHLTTKPSSARCCRTSSFPVILRITTVSPAFAIVKGIIFSLLYPRLGMTNENAVNRG